MNISGTSILTINAGSSSLKFALFRSDGDEPSREFAGKFERIGLPATCVTTNNFLTGEFDDSPIDAPDHAACVRLLLEWLENTMPVGAVDAVAHRVVHGGPHYRQPQRVDLPMLRELRRVAPTDPEHLPAEIGVIEGFSRRYPTLQQFACFDTAFHSSLPCIATLLPIPRKYEAKGIRRYGFHGLSYAYLMEELELIAGPDVAKGRVILAHLGNGASMAAVCNGTSIDTTMGFTPAAGLVMGTRSGDLDPGLVGYLAQAEGVTAEEFHHMINKASGLLGISQISSDVRDLLARETTDVRAAEALGIFCYQAKKWIGALAAALGGVDTLIFSGGIGENSAEIRARICESLGHIGLELAPALNEANAPVITRENSKATVRVIRTDEEIYIARVVHALLKGKATPSIA